MNKTEMVRIGVIGAGRIGKIHAESIAARVEGAELSGVADIDLQAARETAARHHLSTAVAEYQVLLDDPDIDAVAICSATDTHARIIQEAAEAGKHIFCEKPIDHSLSKIDQALASVQAAGVIFQVGFNRRFDPNFRKVRQMVAGGKIGVPHILRITSRDPTPPPISYIEVSGGIFLDMTIHDFDMARYIMGSEVTEVFAAGGVLVDPAIGEVGDLDTAVITLRFENGALGTIDNSRRAVYGYDQRLEVFGSQGMVAVGNNKPDTHVYLNEVGAHFAQPLYFFLERYTESYINEMQEFVASIRDGASPAVAGIDGRIPVVMGLAAKKSAQENRPVLLSEIG
jgi:myo-inositol 2-dehydrogenase/D-chiro-inositol 1-dehydrogenase